MITTKYLRTREDGIKLYRTCSDEYMIQKIGTEEPPYAEAIDVEVSGYTYAETDIPIEEDTDLTLDDAVQMLNSLGVDTDDL